MINVLFVCLGNICRSPLAEGLFQKMVDDAGLSAEIQADSCGTGAYHIGESPHYNSRKVAKQNGLELKHKARQMTAKDLKDFDFILGMDESNIRNIKRLSGFEEAKDKVFMLRAFDNEQSGKAVDDTYGGEYSDFEECYVILEESCRNLLAHIRKEKQL